MGFLNLFGGTGRVCPVPKVDKAIWKVILFAMMKALDKSQHPSKKLSEALFVVTTTPDWHRLIRLWLTVSSGHELLNFKKIILRRFSFLKIFYREDFILRRFHLWRFSIEKILLVATTTPDWHRLIRLCLTVVEDMCLWISKIFFWEDFLSWKFFLFVFTRGGI